MSGELTTTDRQLAAPSVANMLQAVIQAGVTGETVAVLERLAALKEREDASSAQKAFAAAFVRLQSALPKIEPTKEVPDNSGNVRYRFAPYEEIMRKVRPLLNENGFAVSFDNEFADGRVTVTCTLMHVDGHKESKRFACRIGSGPPKSSEAQGDGAAQTYAKRFALCSALNIVIEHDTDGADPRKEGEFITAKEAADLRDRAEACGADESKFLKLAGAETYEEIYAHRLESLHEALAAKEKKNREAAQ